jgi:hypothetical protein
MPSITSLEEEEIVDDQGRDGNTSMPEQVKLPNSWKKKQMTILIRDKEMALQDVFKIVSYN